VDLYKVELKVGDRLLIDTDSVPFTITGNTVPQIVDTNIRLFDSTGNQIAINNDAAAPNEFYSANRDAYLEYFATTAGTYYVGIANGANSYYDPNVAGSGGGRVTPADGRNIGAYNLAIDVQPFQKPEVSIKATPTLVDEEKGTILTLTLNTTGTIPPEGLEVDLQGDVARLLTQFSSLQTRVNADGSFRYFLAPTTVVSGGILGVVDSDLSGFKFRITKPTATIQLPVLNDIVEEPDQTYTYSLKPGGDAYSVSPTSGLARFTITDGVPGGVGPVVGIAASPTALFESEQTAVTLTFRVNGTIPPEGVLVSIDSGVGRSVAEFDVTASNPRTPENNFVATGPIVTGGRIAGTNEIASSILFRITEATATITVPVFQDDEVEGKETFTYRLLDGEKYQVDRNASAVTITIEDTKPVVPPVNQTLFGDIGNNILSSGAGNDNIFGNGGNDVINSGAGNDNIFAGAGSDVIDAGAGNDIIFGNGGNDVINAGTGDDIIYSGAGNDVIAGGAGNDTIWLNGGSDVVVVRRGEGTDTINGFQLGQTKLGLAGGLQFSDLTFTQGNGFTEVLAGSELLAKVNFVSANNLNAANNFTTV
jgi:Ca2+-binding RTX toxin-like protein